MDHQHPAASRSQGSALLHRPANTNLAELSTLTVSLFQYGQVECMFFGSEEGHLPDQEEILIWIHHQLREYRMMLNYLLAGSQAAVDLQLVNHEVKYGDSTDQVESYRFAGLAPWTLMAVTFTATIKPLAPPAAR